MKHQHTYSQHFLRSPRLVEQLVKKTSITKDDTVYDLGAGSGVISSVLAHYAGSVVAVENEPQALALLRRNMGEYGNVEVTSSDILQLVFPKKEYKIFANIPFHLSSALVQRFITETSRPEAAYLIVQKQFGTKLLSHAQGSFTSQLGMLVGVYYDVRIAFRLQKTDYLPRPAVDTMLISLTKRPTPAITQDRFKAYQRFTEECFSDPRKLAALKVGVIGVEAPISPSRLTLTQWISVFNSQKRY